MIRYWIIVGLMTLPVSAARAQDVIIRASLDPNGPVVIGQRVELDVDVLFAAGMEHPPRIADPRVEGAQVFRFRSQGMNIRERIGTVDYAGQSFALEIYPRRPGTLIVPPLQVTLLDQAGDPVGTREGPGLRITAQAPPGLDPSGPIVAASAVTMREAWQPAHQATLRPGDAMVRTIFRSAAGVPGLAMANLPFDAPDGVRAYADPPDIHDTVAQGDVTGTRTDRVTYVFERAGHFVLPAVAQPWWNLARAAPQTLTLPAREIAVLAAPPVPKRSMAAMAAIAGIAALLLLAVVWRPIGRHWARWRHAPRQMERAAFRHLRRHCRGGDAIATYRAWLAWTALHRGDRSNSLHAAIQDLESSIFGAGHEWAAIDARRLERAVAALRRPKASKVPALPALNSLR